MTAKQAALLKWGLTGGVMVCIFWVTWVGPVPQATINIDGFLFSVSRWWDCLAVPLTIILSICLYWAVRKYGGLEEFFLIGLLFFGVPLAFRYDLVGGVVLAVTPSIFGLLQPEILIGAIASFFFGSVLVWGILGFLPAFLLMVLAILSFVVLTSLINAFEYLKKTPIWQFIGRIVKWVIEFYKI